MAVSVPRCVRHFLTGRLGNLPHGHASRLTRISHEHGTFRDRVFVAELARVQTTLNDALNSGECSYKS